MRVPPCLASIPPFILIDSTSELSAIIATDSNAAEGSPGLWNITQFVYTGRLATVPTLSKWGLVAMVAGLGLIGFFVARRRKSAA